MEFGYWSAALKAWKGHGLPAGLETDEDLERCLGLEGVSIFPRVPPDVTLDNYFYDPDRKKNIL
jgi:hypothetical protein